MRRPRCGLAGAPPPGCTHVLTCHDWAAAIRRWQHSRCKPLGLAARHSQPGRLRPGVDSSAPPKDDGRSLPAKPGTRTPAACRAGQGTPRVRPAPALLPCWLPAACAQVACAPRLPGTQPAGAAVPAVPEKCSGCPWLLPLRGAAQHTGQAASMNAGMQVVQCTAASWGASCLSMRPLQGGLTAARRPCRRPVI
jgi:hypothetical protein